MLCQVTSCLGDSGDLGQGPTEVCRTSAYLEEAAEKESCVGKQARVSPDKSALRSSTINYLCVGVFQWARRKGVGLRLKARPQCATGKRGIIGRQGKDREDQSAAQ
ncbi:hypothetical protein AOLI_G00163810 [Acnodon oligacanthus]